MTEHLFARYEAADSKLKEVVGRARQITVYLDKWTKKALRKGLVCHFWEFPHVFTISLTVSPAALLCTLSKSSTHIPVKC